ncbi:MAG: hypothetical protein ACOYN0_06505 [Phycisphaerales bacterium]
MGKDRRASERDHSAHARWDDDRRERRRSSQDEGSRTSRALQKDDQLAKLVLREAQLAIDSNSGLAELLDAPCVLLGAEVADGGKHALVFVGARFNPPLLPRVQQCCDHCAVAVRASLVRTLNRKRAVGISFVLVASNPIQEDDHDARG